jgi:hypothetical protein
VPGSPAGGRALSSDRAIPRSLTMFAFDDFTISGMLVAVTVALVVTCCSSAKCRLCRPGK